MKNEMVRVKICGITNTEDARVAIDTGADMLGFIFYPPSPRYITLECAREIIRVTRQSSTVTRCVGVFVNEPLDHVRVVTETIGLDYVQLHGKETVETVAALAPRAFKSLQPRDADDANVLVEKYRGAINGNQPAFIVDGQPQKLPGGNGTRADWTIAHEIAREFPILLAGGLNAENVVDAIRFVQPWGVDVSSGVERAPGLKDHDKVRAFVKRAKSWKDEDESAGSK